MALTLGNVSRTVADKYAEVERAADFNMLVRCMLAGRGIKGDVLAQAEQLGASERAKSLIRAGALHGRFPHRKDAPSDTLNTGDNSTSGLGDLTPFQSVGEGYVASLAPWGGFDYVWNAGGFRKLPPRTRIALATSIVAGSEVAESALKPVASIATDSAQLTPSKCVAFLVVSDELALRAGTAANNLLLTESNQAAALSADTYFVNTMVNTSGVASMDSSGLSATEFLSDLTDAMGSLTLDNTSRVFCLAPPWAVHAIALANASGVVSFENMTITGGNIQGVEIRPSSALSDSMLVFDSRQIAADNPIPIVDVTNEASLIMDDDPQSESGTHTSLWQRNLRAIRIERWPAAVLLKTSGLIVINNVTQITA